MTKMKAMLLLIISLAVASNISAQSMPDIKDKNKTTVGLTACANSQNKNCFPRSSDVEQEKSKSTKPSATDTTMKQKIKSLEPEEAKTFLNNYFNALGEDALNFRAAFDLAFTPEPKLRQALGFLILYGRSSRLKPCKGVDYRECERILQKTVSASDLERYYYANQETKLLLFTTASFYTRAFFELRGGKDVNLEAEFEAVFAEPCRRFEKRLKEYEEQYFEAVETIDYLENLNAGFRNDLRAIYLKYPRFGNHFRQAKQIKDREAHDNNAFSEPEVANRYFLEQPFAEYTYPELEGELPPNYYEFGGFKMYRDLKSNQLIVFDFEFDPRATFF